MEFPTRGDVLYRGTSLIRNSALLGLYSRTMPRTLWWSWEEELFLMNEVPLYGGGAFLSGRGTPRIQVSGFGFRVSGLGFRVPGFGFRDSRFDFQVLS